MKKAIRILVALCLVLVILGSVVWYLFVYDRDFTRDMLLYQARSFEASGQHHLASILYDITYRYADNDEDIALELAKQYLKADNYTKAEATLTRAISDGGSTRLYQALSSVYVQQDKLLDAVNMLDNITDPIIREAIAVMRPKAPTADQEPGFHNQYISVSFTAETGTVYATADTTYPSISNGQATEPFSLGNGETVLYALAVGDTGLVSPLTRCSYVIGGVVEPVEFSDPAIESILRSALSVAETETVYTDQLWQITQLELPAEAANYADLRLLPHLTKLQITNPIKGELSNLSGLIHLETLSITGGSPTTQELSVIASLPSLRELKLSGCSLSTVRPLEAATQLSVLDLTDNTIRDIGALENMKDLEELYLAYNAVTDLQALKNMSKLRVLDLSHNVVSTIDPILHLTGIQHLYLSGNGLISLGNIQNLISLERLIADGNRLSDVSSLAACTKLIELNLSANDIADISMFSALHSLTHLDFSQNKVELLPQWETTDALVTIDGSYNLLTSLKPLAGMMQLNNVLMDYNEEIETVELLADCPKLTRVSVFGTKVSQVSALTNRGILVNFNPTLD